MSEITHVSLELRGQVTAHATWQANQAKPFWLFSYDWCEDDSDNECAQACLFGGQEPMETIYGGIVRYGLPLPADVEERKRFGAWLATYDDTTALDVKP